MELEILNGLQKLDPQNDEHWTTEGLPRLDVLKDIVGAAVTRVQLQEFAKGFNRINPALPQASAPATVPSVVTATVTNDEQENAEQGLTVAEYESLSVNEQLAVLTSLQAEAIAAIGVAQARYDEVTREMDKLIMVKERQETQNARESRANAVTAYQQAQIAARIARKG